ncbi:hypothetical protein HK101_007259 [Irineochytrium annulatum]|nr:hypothetical protein HK101_007259 [Irineochytrium annulatum]
MLTPNLQHRIASWGLPIPGSTIWGRRRDLSTLSLPAIPAFAGSIARATSRDAKDRAHPAIIDVAKSKTYTHGQLLRDAVAIRDEFLTGIKPEARVAYLAPRSYLAAALQWSAWSSGAIAVPLCSSHTAKELAHVVGDSQPEVALYSSEYTKRIQEVTEELAKAGVKSRTRWVLVDEMKPDEERKVVNVKETAVDMNSGAFLCYTSGTTGLPKGVLWTHANLAHQISSLQQAWAWTKSDRIELHLPLHHVHGNINVLTCAMASGATVETYRGRFDPVMTWERWINAGRYGALTLSMAVPTLYAKLAAVHKGMPKEVQEKATASCKQFRLMVSGSASLPAPQFTRWKEVSGQDLLERYGMTEVGMALGNPLNGKRVPGSVGFPFPGVEARIVGDDGEEVAAGEAGALQIKGPGVFKCYWGKEQETRKNFTEDGWFVTGDVARRDDSGRYWLMGRASADIIKTGGHKMSAIVVEREILGCDKVVADVAVVGVPDEEWGERVGAVVVLAKGCGEGWKEEVRSYLKKRVAGWEVPTVWKVVEEMPRNAMGKVNKKELVKIFQ